MNKHNMHSMQEQRRSLRTLNTNGVEAQRRLDINYQKVGAPDNNIDKLYFKTGDKQSPGRRIISNKNYSSNERAFGLDYTKDQLQSADQAARERGSSP